MSIRKANLLIFFKIEGKVYLMIEVRNLTKKYGNTVAVDDLSFTVDELRAGGETKHGGDLIRKVEGEDIREVQKNELLHIGFVHSSTPRSLVLTLTFSLCCALLWAFS